MDSLVHILARALVFVFFAGIVGSVVVVMISFVEDLELLVEDDDLPGVDAARTRA